MINLRSEIRWKGRALVLFLGLAWASCGLARGSWLGQVPTAAQMFGEEALESAPAVPFEDEENDEDEDADLAVAASSVGPSRAELFRHRKRDAEDELLLRRRAARRGQSGGARDELEEAAEGDEDAWVHDGVDDIQIDPETRRAASDVSDEPAGEKSIDAEYEQQPRQVNRTRITTIAEVIPVGAGGAGGEEEEDELRPEVAEVGSRRAQQPAAAASTKAGRSPAGAELEGEREGEEEEEASPLPAAYLSLEQVVRLVGEQQARAAAAVARGEGRPLAATELRGPGGRQVRLSVVDGATSAE